MSYILEALRKSDQQRRRNAAPTLLLEPAAAEPPRQPALFAYVLLALVLLGAGVAIGWLRPWQSAPTPQMPPASMPRLPEARQIPAQAVPAPQPAPQLAQQPVPAVSDRPPATALGPVPAPASAAIEPAHARPRVVKKSAAPVPVAKEAARGSSPAPAPAAAVMTMAELPLAIQQELPPLSISVHAYSGKAAERLVGINGRLLHEGDSVAPGLALEQITPDGMILSYKGYTFRHGVR